MAKENIITRSKIHMYMNVSTEEKKKEWERMNKGWTKLSENPNAQTESVQYIGEDSATTDTTSYEPSYSFEVDLMAKERTVKKVFDICQDRKTYDDCIVECIKAFAFEATNEDKSVTAYLEKLAVAVSNIDGTKKMTMSGNLNGQGDSVKGKFDLSTMTFTPDDQNDAENSTENEEESA